MFNDIHEFILFRPRIICPLKENRTSY